MLRTLIILLPLVWLSGCAQMHESKDFVRHTNSALVKARDGSNTIQFQARAGSDFPENNPDAEAMRIRWLEDWLEVKNICPNGYKVLKRRPFEFLESNPGQYDLVYEIECVVSVPDDAD